MPTLTLNGQSVTTPDGLNLLEYLREEARLTSVKNGCAEGACGACMVVVDGKATRACLLNTSKLEGKSVITVEGLPERPVYRLRLPEGRPLEFDREHLSPDEPLQLLVQ